MNKLKFRKDFIEFVKSKLSQSSRLSDTTFNKKTSNILYPKKKVNIRDILNSKYTKEIVIFLKKFEEYGYIIEEKKHYFYIERIKHYINELQNYFNQTLYIEPVLVEQITELFKVILDFYNNIDFSKSQKGLFIPCINSKLYKSGEFKFDDSICPICVLNNIQRFIDKFTIYTNKSENSLLEIEQQLEKFELEKDLKFSKKERDILTFLNELDKLVSTISESSITLTNIYLPVIGFIPHIYLEDNDILNINNYQYYILVFNNENELNNFIKPLNEHLMSKGTSLRDINKVAFLLKIEENDDGIKTFSISEPEENVFIDYEVDEFINSIIDNSKERNLIPQNLNFENTIFYKFFEELTFNNFHKSLYNSQKHEIMLNFIKNDLTKNVERLIETLNLSIERLKELVD